MSFRPYPVMSVLTLISLAILIVLGNWQYGRYSHKMSREAEPLVETRLVSVSVEAAAPRKAQNVYGLMDGEGVWRRYVPGRINGTGEPVLALWDAVGGVEPIDLPISGLGTFERESAVFERPAFKPRYGQSNRPEDGVWYAWDGPAILSAFGYEQAAVQVVEPVRVTVRNGEDLSRTRQAANPYASLEPIDPLPPQRHFGYALTWWGLAAALVGVYFAFHVSRGRLSFGSRA